MPIEGVAHSTSAVIYVPPTLVRLDALYRSGVSGTSRLTYLRRSTTSRKSIICPSGTTSCPATSVSEIPFRMHSLFQAPTYPDVSAYPV